MSPNHNQQRMYADLAWLFPIITPPEDYVSEAGEFIQAIRQNARIQVESLLDLGCGSGHNDHTLREHFRVTGVDTSKTMLSLAGKLNPDVRYLVGDMRSARLGEAFDAVIIADAISYMLTEEDLQAAIQTAFEHLKPGGVFATYAEETPDRFVQHGTFTTTHVQGDLSVTLIENYFDPDPTDTTYENTFIYLIRRSGKLQIETDHHLCGIFPAETWPRLLREVGFEVKTIHFEEGDCPMFVGVKP